VKQAEIPQQQHYQRGDMWQTVLVNERQLQNFPLIFWQPDLNTHSPPSRTTFFATSHLNFFTRFTKKLYIM
jgi:hypothetical protein